MTVKQAGLGLAAIALSSFAVLLNAAPPAADGLRVDIVSPADRSRLAWNGQGSYAVTVSYDGKSSRYGEIPSNAVLLRTTYAADADAPAARRAEPLPPALVAIGRSNCMGCHDFTASSAGPSFAAIGKRYAGNAAAIAQLADHIRNGSNGAWGGGSMPPHPDLSPAQATAIAQWIVAHGNDPGVRYSIGKAGSFRMTAPGAPGPRAGLVLSAFYTGPLKPGDDRNSAAGRTVVVVYGSGS
ncbi:MAG TPA: c-type cytochrome [Sphingomonas sp.]|nr:c-type cytochrome [Sphingomonas sp.]